MVSVDLNAVFKALSDPNRLRVVEILAEGEKCACKLLSELNITQPTLSHHMDILQRSGLVTGRREGQWIHYSLDPATLSAVCGYLEGLNRQPGRPQK
ncbi:MAG: metalloregulator ArsR/SmtB family transcription factor [Candidatus Methanomethylophilus sp.]|nr:metalloregulator ArsR/SmtB family transcription factor [Methanomethylophilus sp.]MDD3233032.1 metalloregulator ArsR/SmtB family transcription factor [Methanomethylophilus sp.]MDD4222282.1 metalloregulator ArsR/SmtB family transcription factor [Methanomethylophilus sp.]MDD4668873.1 metalloregulator ArsR/SmtB family transcription factor [Methanomethylophilus sp.]